MTMQFRLRLRRARNGDVTLAVEDDRGRVYAGLDPERVDMAYKLRDIVKTAYAAGQNAGEPDGLAILNRDGRYDIAGLSSGTIYAGISKGLFGANRGEARRLFEIVDSAYQRGQGIDPPVAHKPPAPVKPHHVRRKPAAPKL